MSTINIAAYYIGIGIALGIAIIAIVSGLAVLVMLVRGKDASIEDTDQIERALAASEYDEEIEGAPV